MNHPWTRYDSVRIVCGFIWTWISLWYNAYIGSVYCSRKKYVLESNQHKRAKYIYTTKDHSDNSRQRLLIEKKQINRRTTTYYIDITTHRHFNATLKLTQSQLWTSKCIGCNRAQSQSIYIAMDITGLHFLEQGEAKLGEMRERAGVIATPGALFAAKA